MLFAIRGREKQMGTLHSLLALYGALDDAVTAANDPESPVTETVERFLPGTTGPGRRGWFDDVRLLVRRLSNDPAQTEFPDRAEALSEIAGLRTPPTDTGVRGESTISPPEIVRFLYVMGAHCQLRSPAEEDELFANALAIAVPGRTATEQDAGGRALLEIFTSGLRGGGDFSAAIAAAAAHQPPLVSAQVAALVSNTRVDTTIRYDHCGNEYAVISVEYANDPVSVAQIKRVVDPLNWKRCCQFFCDMRPLKPDSDDYGWSRVLEVISTLCGGYSIKTAIKYWKADLPDGAYINYDLDDARTTTPDNGVVLVDRGFIRFENTATGMRIRTRKEVKFAGIPSVATIIFAIVGGYASIGQSMLVGCALNPPDDAIDWQPSRPTAKQPKPHTPQPCTPEPGSCGCGSDAPINPAFAQAVDMWARCVTDMSAEYAQMVNRWTKCGVDTDELVDFGTRASVRLATDPWRILGLMLDGAKAPPPDKHHNHRSGGR